MRALVLAFHDVVDNMGGPSGSDLLRACPDLYAINRQRFAEHLSEIVHAGGDVRVTTVRCKSHWRGACPILLTFDDGAAGAYTCASPELEKHNWHGHFFITTDWIGKPGFLSISQIRELHQQGHVIGSHTCTHPARMSSLSRSELIKEWSRSKAILSDIVESEVRVASVADGYYSRKVAETAAECGISVLFTSQPTTGVTEVAGCIVIGRYTIKAVSPTSLSRRLTAGNVLSSLCQSVSWELKKAAKAAAGAYYLSLRRAALRRK